MTKMHEAGLCPADEADARDERRSALDRRGFLRAAAGVAAMAGMTDAATARYERGSPPVRYPDPDIVTIDKRFNKYKLGNTPIQRLHTGMMWAEGPAWNAVGRYLLWSDIPNDVNHRWLEESGDVSQGFRSPAGNSNGNTFDYQGRQLACQHGTRKVVALRAQRQGHRSRRKI